ncbi:hypothetical protein HDA32_005616 [Spinactinospora alkalitolerans]|uniref:DUF1440 domain-containing protein n=1 Tax=Spinactinospora alkalitolerans TaxID=687207 RepID=A0A852U0X2_9ACTN|nr:DUF1440 domain-containing protein [Spinactinospora alkalitolerans]NYE50496.1 hypothetical protein [Spinactinospora alkalitolerans]
MRDATVDGAVAGAVGVWAMDVATWTMYRKEPPELLEQEKRARVFGKDVAHAAARRLARMAGSDVARDEPNAGGIFVHYLLGIGPGVAYAQLRRRHPWIAAGKGALWGTALFVINDEVAGPLARVASGPRSYPWQTHVRGLVGHVVLGVATHVVLDALDRAP